MRKIDELKQELTTLEGEVRSLLNEDKVKEAEVKMEEQRSLKSKIKIQEELDAQEEREVNEKMEKREEKQEERQDNKQVEYRDAFYKMVRGVDLNSDERRSLTAGSATAGGHTVPKSFQKKLIDKLEELNIMRKLATVIQTDSDMDIPVIVSHGTAAWTAEEGAYNESDDVFGQITLKAFKLTRIIKVSEELLQDSAFDLENYLVNEFARSIAKAEENAFVAGDGVDKPEGVFVGAEVGLTAASGSALKADEIVDLYYSLPRPYREKAVFIANDSTVKVIRKLKDSEGNYLWEKGLGGEPSTILGRPVHTSEFSPEIGVNANVIAFGDMSYYQIADRKTRVFQRLNEKYADFGQVGFRGYERVDGKLTLAEAVKVLKMAAV
ncbi:phage major capsid protein [Rossellomorea sp. BNER]|uniref:phage major capsid protein n=1 Tax=Rossellomorea sp. BNER TaxID=2962031 RepID=UPI003AF30D49|nr:phage major capsid protein [Rossellomorea sp. BNER]